MRNHLAQFGYLQLLDLLTTLIALSHRGEETNPLVELLIRSFGSPITGLAVTKLAAFAVALYCWRRKRLRVLWIVNLFYSAVVVWNLVAMLLSHPHA